MEKNIFLSFLKNVQSLVNQREPALEVLFNLQCLLQIVDKNIYQEHAIEAKKRIKNRDLNDWPIIATALTFNCPIWTEDQDFFGSGIPIWTTDSVHVFFDSLNIIKN